MNEQWVPADDTHEESATIDRLDAELEQSDLARHLAFFYDSPETQLAVAATFVRRALRSNHRCLYFFDSNTSEMVEGALREVGIEVDQRLAAGDLLVERGADVYAEADFDPATLVALLEETSHESVADGYDGLWIAGETSWCFHTDLSYDHVVDFEADFDAACPDLPVTALCQYDLGQFSENSIAKALWTHEQVIYRDRLCENPFYIPPAEFRSAVDQPLNTRLMLEQAYNLALAKQEIERREQRLAVVNRILRHNVRNDLSVTRGILDLIRETEYIETDEEDLLDTALDHIDDVTEKADRARYVQRTLDEATVQREQLAAVFERVTDRVEMIRPDASITVEGTTDVSIVADTNIDVALTELCLYGIRNGEGDPPDVSISVSDTPEGDVRVDIAYPGPSVPPEDRRVLETEAETQLDHANGLGLWLVKWIVENSHGRLQFPADGGAQICLQFRTATR